jgi:type I restriction enzyme, S subunit
MSFPRYERYKDSGVEWLGDLPEHWETRRLRFLIEIRKRIVGELGPVILSITQQGIKVRDVDSNDGQVSMDYSKYQIVEPGDFAMNHMDLLTGYVDISPLSGVTSPDYRVFSTRRDCGCNDKYLLYIFQNGYKGKIFYAFGQGSSQFGRWRLPTEAFKDFSVPLPSLDEQSNIVKFIDSQVAKIDGLIDEQRRLIELLKEKRQAVILHAVTKGLNPNVVMEDSGVEWMGLIPAHWTVMSLGRVTTSACDGPFGSGLKSDHYVDAGVRVVRLQNIRSGEFDGTDAAFIDPIHYANLGNHDVRGGDLLIAGLGDDRNAVGRACVAPPHIEPAMVKADCFRFRLTSEVAPKFIAAQLSIGAPADAGRLAAGSTRSRIPVSRMCSRAIAIPDMPEQLAIVKYLRERELEFAGLRDQAELGISLLQERRSALISAAVTGKIDVRNFNPTEAA